MNEEEQNKFFDSIISKINNITGVDYIYFLDKESQIIKEYQFKGTNNYSEQISSIINSEQLLKKIGVNLYSKEFHTYTLLNENGLIVILKLPSQENIHMVVIAGESEPVDLINLLKICKESRLDYVQITH